MWDQVQNSVLFGAPVIVKDAASYKEEYFGLYLPTYLHSYVPPLENTLVILETCDIWSVMRRHDENDEEIWPDQKIHIYLPKNTLKERWQGFVTFETLDSIRNFLAMFF